MAQRMGEHTEKQVAYLRQKQGRSKTHLMRPVGVLSEEECSKEAI